MLLLPSIPSPLPLPFRSLYMTKGDEGGVGGGGARNLGDAERSGGLELGHYRGLGALVELKGARKPRKIAAIRSL